MTLSKKEKIERKLKSREELVITQDTTLRTQIPQYFHHYFGHIRSNGNFHDNIINKY